MDLEGIGAADAQADGADAGHLAAGDGVGQPAQVGALGAVEDLGIGVVQNEVGGAVLMGIGSYKTQSLEHVGSLAALVGDHAEVVDTERNLLLHVVVLTFFLINCVGCFFSE